MPANAYNVDYSILGTTMVEDVIRPIRLGMAGAGIRVEDSKGECNFGQHEVNFRYSDALTMADNHAIYKNGAKEIAHAHGYALSFMAKYDEREGNSCHIHCSLWDENGTAFADGDGHQTELFRHFLAGQLAGTRELTLCFAPNINSYKRYAWGSFAPTTLAWGVDNRTCAFRIVGHGPGLRVESRLAGADTNPYLAFAAIIAAGLHGIENSLDLEDAYARQRLRRPRQAAGALEPRGRDRPVRGLSARARGVRSAGRRPLPPLRAHGAQVVRSRGHGLGEVPQLRKALADPATTPMAPGPVRGLAPGGALYASTQPCGVRERLDQLVAALGAPLDLALAGEPHEVVPLALPDRMAVFVARSRK